MTDELKKNVVRDGVWWRLLYMILFVIIWGVAEIILAGAVVLQFGFVLFTGDRNRYVLAFGKTLSRFFYDILLYLTFSSDEKPFPFSPWPSSDESSK